MKPAVILFVGSALALPLPAAAQHAHHGSHSAPAAGEIQPDPHAGHHMHGGAQPDPSHAGHGVHHGDHTTADPHAGHRMPPPEASDPHAGHVMPEQHGTDPHAGHTMPGQSAAPAPPVAPPPARAFEGPENAAETIFDPAVFRQKRRERLIDEHGGMATWSLMAEQLEYRIQDGRNGYKWDVQGWYGGDYDKLWLKSEGEGAFGEAAEEIEVQGLFSRALDPWFNLQVGVRQDFRPRPQRTHLVLGVQGLAPYWFEIDGSLFLSDKGDFTARFEAEYDQRLTNKLILQPLVEIELAAQDIPELAIGSGLTSIEAGLRLRYEFKPEFAPYIGVEYARKFGDTADFARADGEHTDGWTLMLGLRTWF